MTNTFSCLILFLTIRHAYKQTQLNTLVTVLHVTIIVGTTISAFLLDTGLLVRETAQLRLFSATFVFTALQDIFISYNIFFILDEQKTIIIVINGAQIKYPILNVVKMDTPISSSQL